MAVNQTCRNDVSGPSFNGTGVQLLVHGQQNTHQNAVTVTGNGTDAPVACFHDAAVYITGTATSRTVSFLGSVDGTNFVAIQGTKLADGTVAASTTGTTDEIWRFSVAGLLLLRVAVTAISGGNLTAKSYAIR